MRSSGCHLGPRLPSTTRLTGARCQCWFAPAAPTNEFPDVGIFNGYVRAFRKEQIDDEWAKPTEATLGSRLTELDPNVVRGPLLERRCGLCVLGYIIAAAEEGRNPQPGVDLPAWDRGSPGRAERECGRASPSACEYPSHVPAMYVRSP